MGYPDDYPTPFAPDGSIADPVLLRLIEEADPLPPAALLKLGPFFAQIRTYTVLADTLVASALLSMVDKPPEAKGPETLLDAAISPAADSFVDTFVENSAEPPRPHDPGDDKKYVPSWFHILASGTNIGLLIEKIDEKFFAVAVSPDPATLSDD